MDSQQFNFDWNSADLADFGANLSANLSTGLSISDSIQVSTLCHMWGDGQVLKFTDYWYTIFKLIFV